MCRVLYSCAGLEAAQKHGPMFLIMLEGGGGQEERLIVYIYIPVYSSDALTKKSTLDERSRESYHQSRVRVMGGRQAVLMRFA